MMSFGFIPGAEYIGLWTAYTPANMAMLLIPECRLSGSQRCPMTDRDVLEEARERTATAQAERDAALATRQILVRALAEGWLTEPCVGGYRITNGNDDDSQCLHCAADVLLEALDGGEQ